MKPASDTNLVPLALTLIFIPDPITTIIGIGLLGYIRRMRQQEELGWHRMPDIAEGFYTYRTDMQDYSTITFRVFTTRQGQLPFPQQQTSRLYCIPQRGAASQGNGIRQTSVNPPSLSKLQPAGLLGRLQPQDTPRFFTPRLTTPP